MGSPGFCGLGWSLTRNMHAWNGKVKMQAKECRVRTWFHVGLAQHWKFAMYVCYAISSHEIGAKGFTLDAARVTLCWKASAQLGIANNRVLQVKKVRSLA